MRPKLLDLFCGAGGAAMGYHRAGFDVVGVDTGAQPRYPFEWLREDAMEILQDGVFLSKFDAIHASPPCQRFSTATFMRPERSPHQDLVTPTLKALQAFGKPFVIENVPRAPLGPHNFWLCGLMFGLKMFRHRRFACSHVIFTPEHPSHRGLKIGVGGMVCMAGHGDSSRRHRKAVPADHRNKAAWMAASGIDWMARDEMAQSVPPPYTEHIGKQLIRALEAAV